MLLADRPDGYFNPEDEPMDIVDIDELDIPHAERFRFRYRVIEHDTARKALPTLTSPWEERGRETDLLRSRHPHPS